MARHAICKIFVPQPVVEPEPLAVRAWSLNHWATRVFPQNFYFSTDNLMLYWEEISFEILIRWMIFMYPLRGKRLLDKKKQLQMNASPKLVIFVNFFVNKILSALPLSWNWSSPSPFHLNKTISSMTCKMYPSLTSCIILDECPPLEFTYLPHSPTASLSVNGWLHKLCFQWNTESELKTHSYHDGQNSDVHALTPGPCDYAGWHS